MEIPATGYQSQEEAIRQKAEEQGIPFAQLDACFDKTIQELRELPGADSRWELQRAEKLVWDHFCKHCTSFHTTSRAKITMDWGHLLLLSPSHVKMRL